MEPYDKAALATLKAPRVTLESIESNILDRYFFTGNQAAAGVTPNRHQIHPSLDVLTICILVLRNGFTVVGKSAPASPESFRPELGRAIALDDAMRQIWPLMGYELRQRLYESEKASGEAHDIGG